VNAFLGAEGRADIAVVIVTFNNADHVDGLFASLRAEAGALRLRVVVVDNGSTDATRERLAQHPDAIVVDGNGNRGYAAGINLAIRRVGDTGSILVLNPDLALQPGALAALLARLRDSAAGAVVPRILEPGGHNYPSLRREPSIGRALGDALLGSRFPRRPASTSEIDAVDESYTHAHPVDWATGAAILIDAAVAAEVGDWDPRFFLYSEETDFFARLRALGHTVWFEPEAVVLHDRGGSGSSPQLSALMAANRVRYVRKHRGRGYAAAFHATVILHEAMRAWDPVHRSTLRVLIEPAAWRRLPRATRWPAASAERSPGGAIVIPAHNEGAVIDRTLRPLAALARSGRTEVIVVCNGCTDDTAEIARRHPGVTVLEAAVASKAGALNAGDAAASAWPRLYLDADIEIHPGAVAAVFSVLRSGGVLAARPAFRYDTAGAGPLVRAYYRARERMPSAHSALWGAGVYGLSEAGHERLGAFPALTADDLVVESAFARTEKRIVDTEPVRVRTPRSTAGLLAILARQHRGTAEARTTDTTADTARELLASVRGPLSLVDAAVYAALTLAGRRQRRRYVSGHWERDESSRIRPQAS
jgi:GT2 family glycosyltransferase